MLLTFKDASIPLDARKDEFSALCPNLIKCGPGIFGHIAFAKLLLSLLSTKDISLKFWLANLRTLIIHADLAPEFCRQHNIGTEYKIHVNNGFLRRAFKTNGWNPITTIDKIDDPYIRSVQLDDWSPKSEEEQKIAIANLLLFDARFISEYSPARIGEYVVQQFQAAYMKILPEAKEGWVDYDINYINNLGSILKTVGIEDLGTSFFDTKEEGDKAKIRFNPELFKFRFAELCHSKGMLFKPEAWIEIEAEDKKSKLVFLRDSSSSARWQIWVEDQDKNMIGNFFDENYLEESELLKYLPQVKDKMLQDFLFQECFHHEYYTAIKQLLVGRDVNKPLNDKDTTLLLIQAIKKGDLKLVQLLLANQDKNSRLLYASNEQGKAPLFLAAELGHIEIVNLLLAKGVRHRDGCMIADQYVTPLEIAEKNGHKEIVKIFKAQEQSKKIKTISGDIRREMENQINPDSSDKPSGHLIANIHESAKQGKDFDVMVCRYIIYKNIFPLNNRIKFLDRLPAKSEKEKIARAELKTVIDKAYTDALNVTDEKSTIQLLRQIDKEMEKLAKDAPNSMLSYQLDESRKESEKGIASFFSGMVKYGFSDQVQLLLNVGVNLSLRTDGVMTPLEIADERKQTDIAKLIRDHQLGDPLFKLKQDIKDLTISANSIRGDAVNGLKGFAIYRYNEAALPFVYSAFQQLDACAEKLLIEPGLDDGPVGKAVRKAFMEVLTVKDESQAKRCLDQFRDEMLKIKNDISAQLQTQATLFKPDEQIKVIRAIEEMVGREGMTQTPRKGVS